MRLARIAGRRAGRGGFGGSVKKIPHRRGEQRGHPVAVKAGLVGGSQPADEAGPQRLLLGQARAAQGAADERALTWLALGEAAVLELAVGLEDRVGVDRQGADCLLDRRQPVAFGEVTEPQGLLDLMDELEVGRHA
jgi:hypothetical protein